MTCTIWIKLQSNATICMAENGGHSEQFRVSRSWQSWIVYDHLDPRPHQCRLRGDNNDAYSVLIRVKVVSIINYKSHILVIEVDVIQQNYHNYRPIDSHYVSKAI